MPQENSCECERQTRGEAPAAERQGRESNVGKGDASGYAATSSAAKQRRTCRTPISDIANSECTARPPGAVEDTNDSPEQGERSAVADPCEQRQKGQKRDLPPPRSERGAVRARLSLDAERCNNPCDERATDEIDMPGTPSDDSDEINGHTWRSH